MRAASRQWVTKFNVFSWAQTKLSDTFAHKVSSSPLLTRLALRICQPCPLLTKENGQVWVASLPCRL